MACLDEDDVVALVEGRLAPEERARADHHLDRCDGCRALVAHAAHALLPTAEASAEDLAGSGRGALTEWAPSEGALAAGARIGPYRVLARIGSGAMGVVYAAEHVTLRRKVALKVVRAASGRGPDERQLRGRLLREARAASAVRHRHVVTVHDVLELDDGSPVMVMDLLEGEPLRARMTRKGTLSEGETVSIALAILDALDAAHRLGVVHRDLKPDNVFLARAPSGDSEVKIVDFGIAKLTAFEGSSHDSVGLTETGMLVGTPSYMAPEQAFGDGAVDARADLWAVGAIAYECLSGRRPIEGDSIGQLLRELARMNIRPLAEVAPSASPALCRIVDGLLVEREARPSSAAELKRALARVDPPALAASTQSLIDSADGFVVPRPARSWLGRSGSGRLVNAGVLALAVVLIASMSARLSTHAPATLAPPRLTPAARTLPAPAVEPPRATPAAAAAGPAEERAAPAIEPRPPRRPLPPPGATESAEPASAPAPGPGKLLTAPPF